MLDYYFQGQFKKDLKLMQKRRYNMDAIYDVIAMIVWGNPCRNGAAPMSFPATMKDLRSVTP